MNGTARRVAVVVGVALAVSSSLAPVQARTTPTAGLHPGNDSFQAPSPVLGTFPGGPSTINRPFCKSNQIESAAFTERSPDGVLGVVELKGTKYYHQKHIGRLRCALPIERGPRSLVAADGQPLDVSLGRADSVNPGNNLFSWINLTDGSAAWGFGWFGTYCGPAPRYVTMKLENREGTLNVPYDGPVPPCPSDPGAVVSSTLTDGSSGASNAPVQPAPPSYLSLSTSAQFVGTTTHKRPARVEVTITDTAAQPVVLTPCPYYEVRTNDRVGKHRGFLSSSIDDKTPGCKTAPVTVTPSQPVSFRVPPSDVSVGSPFGAPKGSKFTVYVDLPGMPTATVSTTVK